MNIPLKRYWELLAQHIRPQRLAFGLLTVLRLTSILLQMFNPQILLGTVAVVTMLTINATITLIAMLPFIFVGILSNSATKRIETYRRASRKASGVVRGDAASMAG
jgi:ABC-type multidrug transport system fused ATPase/permease subunit